MLFRSFPSYYHCGTGRRSSYGKTGTENDAAPNRLLSSSDESEVRLGYADDREQCQK